MLIRLDYTRYKQYDSDDMKFILYANDHPLEDVSINSPLSIYTGKDTYFIKQSYNELLRCSNRDNDVYYKYKTFAIPIHAELLMIK